MPEFDDTQKTVRGAHDQATARLTDSDVLEQAGLDQRFQAVIDAGLIETPAGGLSHGMRSLNGRYTQWFNRRRGREGPERRYGGQMSSISFFLAANSSSVRIPCSCSFARS